jgi:hypothetical protein
MPFPTAFSPPGTRPWRLYNGQLYREPKLRRRLPFTALLSLNIMTALSLSDARRGCKSDPAYLALLAKGWEERRDRRPTARAPFQRSPPWARQRRRRRLRQRACSTHVAAIGKLRSAGLSPVRSPSIAVPLFHKLPIGTTCALSRPTVPRSSPQLCSRTEQKQVLYAVRDDSKYSCGQWHLSQPLLQSDLTANNGFTGQSPYK